MRYNKNLIFMLLAVFLVFSFAGFAEDKVVTVEGEADASMANAREKAVENALRNAVEMGFGVYIDSATLTENATLISDDIVAEAKGFVRSYEVIDSKESGGVLTVTVKAVISMDKVWESDSLGVLLKRMGAPRFIVVTSEEIVENDTPEGTPTSQKLTEELVKRGFYLKKSLDMAKLSREMRNDIVNDTNQALKMGKSEGAEIVVIADSKVSFEKEADMYGKKMLYFTGICEAKAVQVGTGKIIASATGKSMRGAANAQEAIHDAFTYAASGASDDLVKGMLASWSKYLNTGRTIEVTVKNISVTDLSRLIEKMKSMEGVSDVAQRGYAKRTATLHVKSKQKVLYIAGQMEDIPGMKLTIESFDSDNIIAKKR